MVSGQPEHPAFVGVQFCQTPLADFLVLLLGPIVEPPGPKMGFNQNVAKGHSPRLQGYFAAKFGHHGGQSLCRPLVRCRGERTDFVGPARHPAAEALLQPGVQFGRLDILVIALREHVFLLKNQSLY